MKNSAESSHELNQESTNNTEYSKWSILEEYAKDERNRIDVLKNHLGSGGYDIDEDRFLSQEETLQKYEQEKIIDRPKITKKIGRAVLDSLNIRFRASETQRDREAMATAIEEYTEEKTSEILQDTEEALSNSVKSIMKQDEIEAREAEFERERLLDAMSREHEVLGWSKEEFYKNMARQESLEREFNDNLTSIDEIELYAEAGDPRVVKESIKYGGQEIPVYKLKGFPMKFLAHVLNYRDEGDNINTGGREMSDRLIKNPDLWNAAPEDYQKGSNWNLSKAIKANTLSTSYVDLTTGIDSYDHLPRRNIRIIYGFDHIRPTSLIYAAHRDGHIPPRVNQSNAYRDHAINMLDKNVKSISELNDDNATNMMYNEVAMFRYDEKGNALQPKFMITDLEDLTTPNDDLINSQGYRDDRNAIKKHAAAHGIPIIQIDRNSYPNPY